MAVAGTDLDLLATTQAEGVSDRFGHHQAPCGVDGSARGNNLPFVMAG